MDFTRKNYLELFRDGLPVIAGGRKLNDDPNSAD